MISNIWKIWDSFYTWMDRTVRIARIPKVAIQNRKKERENKERTIEGKKENRMKKERK